MAKDVRSMQHKGMALTVLGVASMLALSGCASGGSGDQPMKMGATIANSTNPFYVQESRTAETTAKKLGLRVISQEASEDVQKQSNQIDQFITSQVDFIVIDPVDSNGVGPAVKRAKTANVPVVSIDSVTKNADVSVTTNNVQAGKISCEFLAKTLGGKGNIAIVDGTPIEAVSDRVVGCKQTLKKYPDIKVVAHQRGDNSRDKGLTVATDILTANPNLDGIFAINDPTATGVELAAKQKGITVAIASVDGAQAAIDSITSGGQIIATAAQNPAALAKRGTEIGHKLAKGGKEKNKHIELPTKLITADNVSSYTPWG